MFGGFWVWGLGGQQGCARAEARAEFIAAGGAEELRDVLKTYATEVLTGAPLDTITAALRAIEWCE